MLKKWMQIIDKYHGYLIIPFIVLFLTVWWQNQINGCIVCSSSDESIFFNSIRFIVDDPTKVYSTGLYYLPFFCLIFYIFTLGGLSLFSQLFFYTGFFLFCISLVLVDFILIERKIPVFSRLFYLILMVLGDHLKIILYYNQSKFYVVFFIVLICYWVDKKPAWVIHLMFQFVIAIMTHLIFWYLFFIALSIRDKYQRYLHRIENNVSTMTTNFQDTADSNSYVIPHGNTVTRRRKLELIRDSFNLRQILSPIFLAIFFFVLTNCLFIIYPRLITDYYSRVFGGYLRLDYDYAIRVEHSIVPFLLYRTYGITDQSMWLFIITATAVNCGLVYKNIHLITSLGINCLLLIAFDPLLMEMYYIFLFLGVFLWIAHDLNNFHGFLRSYDYFLHICFIFIVIYHWSLGPYRYLLYLLFLVQSVSIGWLLHNTKKRS